MTGEYILSLIFGNIGETNYDLEKTITFVRESSRYLCDLFNLFNMYLRQYDLKTYNKFGYMLHYDKMQLALGEKRDEYGIRMSISSYKYLDKLSLIAADNFYDCKFSIKKEKSFKKALSTVFNESVAEKHLFTEKMFDSSFQKLLFDFIQLRSLYELAYNDDISEYFIDFNTPTTVFNYEHTLLLLDNYSVEYIEWVAQRERKDGVVYELSRQEQDLGIWADISEEDALKYNVNQIALENIGQIAFFNTRIPEVLSTILTKEAKYYCLL